MNNQEKLIENSISRLGLRTLDIIAYGRAVNVTPWLMYVPDEAVDLMRVIRREEAEIGIQHAILVWNAREMVEFVDAPIRFGVMWWIGKGERMSFCIDLAASYYKKLTGLYPMKCWVNELPKGAPDEMEIEGLTGDPPTQALKLRIAGWVPQRYVVVGIEKMYIDMSYKDGRYTVQKLEAV